VEFLKNDQVDYESMMALNMGQILSIPAVITGILILVYAVKKNHNKQVG
jgi:prolipoprotein diacylglyceryltransferase